MLFIRPNCLFFWSRKGGEVRFLSEGHGIIISDLGRDTRLPPVCFSRQKEQRDDGVLFPSSPLIARRVLESCRVCPQSLLEKQDFFRSFLLVFLFSLFLEGSFLFSPAAHGTLLLFGIAMNKGREKAPFPITRAHEYLVCTRADKSTKTSKRV